MSRGSKFSSNGESSYGPRSPATGGASYALCQFVPLVLQLSGQVSLQLPVQPSSSLRRTRAPTVQKATLVAATFRPPCDWPSVIKMIWKERRRANLLFTLIILPLCILVSNCLLEQ
jgi:hypothetical protein